MAELVTGEKKQQMKRFLIIALVIFISQNIFPQGIIRGKVTDENGEALTGATIVIKSTSNGTSTDFDGNYSLGIASSSPQKILVSFIGYQTIEEPIQLINNEIVLKNYTMIPATVKLEDVTVVGKAKRENDGYMKMVKMKSAVSLDYISKETIRKTGDSQVDEAIKRVPGVSTVGGFISVRGLADRYIKTTVNGARIPTLDPFTNNIKLDMFPTGLIDNIVITKTATPDLPGDWAGSYLSIETKDYPDKLSISITSSVGYNDQSTFNEKVMFSEIGPTDWLGYDNGFRDIYHPKDNFPYINANPDEFEIFSEAGLSDFLHSLGINETHFEDPYNSRLNDDIYRNLCLNKLGFLPGALFYDTEASTNAYKEFGASELHSIALFNLNKEVYNFKESLPKKWKSTYDRNLPDFSQDITFGNQVNLFNRPLGFLGGIRYSSSMKYDPDAFKYGFIFNNGVPEEDLFITSDQMRRQMSVKKNAWSALLNASYKLNNNNSVSLRFMPNFSGISNAQIDSVFDFYKYDNLGYLYTMDHNQLYEERKQLVYQYQSHHFLPGPRIRFEIAASYTDGESSTPDYRAYEYGGFDTINYNVYRIHQSKHPERVFRYLFEDILDVGFSSEIPLSGKPGVTRKLKIGSSYLNNTKEWEQFKYALFNSSIDSIGEYYTYNNDIYNFAKGYSRVYAGFFMLDIDIFEWLRAAGGLRVEKTDMLADLTKFFGEEKSSNEEDRIVYTELGTLLLNPSKRNQINYLPSLNLIMKVINNDKILLNTRLNYNKSIARPSIREISTYYAYDYSLGTYVWGNPELKMTRIDNYDLRFESFFISGDFLSMSFFYKRFENHIEANNDRGYYTWQNANLGEAYGIELEIRKQFLKDFELSGNLSRIFSQTEVELIDPTTYQVEGTQTRTMWGQSPFIVNGILSYKNINNGFSATLSYNVQGPKLAFVTYHINNPDIYEMPRHLMDFKCSRTFGKHYTISLKIRDILKSPVVWSYDYDDFGLNWEKFNFGTTYTLSVSYNL